MRIMTELFLRYKYLLIVVSISFLSVFSLLNKGFPPTHDGEYHVIRFYEFDKTLRDGNWYPRWAPDLNNRYGIPLFNYVYPLPNFVASFLHSFGISFIDSFKINMFLASVIGGIFFYFWAREFWGNLGGAVSSAFYSFSPYHFLDIYIRGSVGEVWALGLFPVFLWAITKFYKSKNKTYLIVSGISLSLIILSHNILAYMFILFVIPYCILLIFSKKNKRFLIINSLYIILISLGLSAIFWIPAIFEQKYVTGLQIYNIKDNFPELFELIIPSWGSGFSGGNLQDQMSFQIGVGNLTVLLVAMFVAAKLIYKKNKEAKIMTYFIICFFIIIFLMLKQSLFIWEKIPFMNYFQFPWRFLSLEILVLSFLAGKVFGSRPILGYVSILLVILLGVGYAKPAFYHLRDDNYYISRSNFIDGTNSPGNVFNTIWMNTTLKKDDQKIKSISNGETETLNTTSTNYKFIFNLNKNSEVTVNTAYFPGWIGIVNNKIIATFPDKNGLISFNAPKGRYSFELKFIETPTRKFAEIISMLTSILIPVLFLYPHFVKIKR